MPEPNPNLSRHARHIALAQVGASGQRKISAGSALLIGVGGIGCAAASYLASSGVGHLLLCDFDSVDETNLGRQTLYGPDDVGKQKAPQAAARLSRMNPDINIRAITERLNNASLAEAVAQADVVLDGSDNFATRFQVNAACVAASTCLISGAAIRLEGQLAVFGPDFRTSPCYRCLYLEADESLENCAGNGVLAPVPGAVGTLMAVEALKFLAGIESRRGVLQLFDGLGGEFRSLSINKRDDCPVCRP
jgi:molybdopterin/thiamine biosynthesis adenylyltransferase